MKKDIKEIIYTIIRWSCIAFIVGSCAMLGSRTMEYNFDSLHIEIDNSAAELEPDPFDALDIWHMDIEMWKTKNNLNTKE